MQSRTPTRTDVVDAKSRQIELWRTAATRGRTAARAFKEIAADIENASTKGDVADEVVDLIVEWCKAQSTEYATLSTAFERLADRMACDLGIGS